MTITLDNISFQKNMLFFLFCLFLVPVKHFLFFPPMESYIVHHIKVVGIPRSLSTWSYPLVATASPVPKPQGYLEHSLSSRQL